MELIQELSGIVEAQACILVRFLPKHEGSCGGCCAAC